MYPNTSKNIYGTQSRIVRTASAPLYGRVAPNRLTVFEECPDEDELAVPGGMTPDRHAYILGLFKKKACKLVLDRRKELEDNGAFAALCVRDAFEGRLGNGLATNSSKSPFIFAVYSLQTNDKWMNLVILSSAFHTMLTYMEPGCSANTCEGGSDNGAAKPVIFYLHYMVWLIHALDAGMKMVYQGVRAYFNHDWQQLYFLAIVLHFLDLCVYGRTYTTNPLRPVVGLLRDRRGRRFFSVVKLILYQMKEFLMPLFAFVLMIAVGNVLIDSDPHALVYYIYNWLCLILTNDTFDRLFPNMVTSTDILSALLIFLLMYFGQGFIVNVLLGATLETFRSVSTKQIKKENLKRNQGLVKAFSVLDSHKTGRIQQAHFSAFLEHWKPELNREQLNLYYELASEGDQEGMTVFQFLKLPHIVRYYFEEETLVTKQIDASNIYIQDVCKRLRPYCYDPSQRELLMRLRNCLHSWKIFYYLNYVDILMFVLQVQDNPFVISSSLSPTICQAISASYALEFTLELSYREGDLYGLLTELNSFFLRVFTTGVVGVLGIDVLRVLGFLHLRGVLARLFFRSLRCCRILVTNSDLSAFCASVLSVGPLFCENMVFGLVVLYMFGMTGYLLFGTMEMWATPLRATVTVQKLFLPFDLLDIMETTMEQVHKLSILFFSLYFLMTIIVSNLSLSIILEWYAQIFEELSQPATSPEKSVVSHEILFNTIKDRVICRKTSKQFTSIAAIAKAQKVAKLYEPYRMYTKDKKADYRMKFVDDNIEHLSPEDLEACRNYSNIDLAAFSKIINRQQKDLSWETDFVEHARKNHGMRVIQPGTTFIVKGNPALKCFLISSGTVTVEMSDENSTAINLHDNMAVIEIGPINLLGSACLTPSSKYKYTCQTVTAVECLIFSQESILSEVDSDHAGQLLRMAHKTHTVLTDLFTRRVSVKETQQKIKRRRKSAAALESRNLTKHMQAL